MNRNNFLKGVGLVGLGLSLGGSKTAAANTLNPLGNCVLIPSETPGPFPLDLTENTYYFRQDVREGLLGVPLNLKLKIIDVDTCQAMPNIRVNIWHCDKDGVYSGYNTGGNPGNVNGTAFRGYQFTDVNGELTFTTILPGWYPGRICHIHFQVHVSSAYSAVSQLTFPLEEKNNIYTQNPALYPKGIDPLNFATDGVFNNNYQYQLASLQAQAYGNANGNANDSYLEVAVKGVATGVGHIERETAKVFELGQNFPNPYNNKTQIAVNLKQAAAVKLELWNLQGQKVSTVVNETKNAGQFNIDLTLSQLGLPNGNYIYQFEARNHNGTFRLAKMMSVQQ